MFLSYQSYTDEKFFQIESSIRSVIEVKLNECDFEKECEFSLGKETAVLYVLHRQKRVEVVLQYQTDEAVQNFGVFITDTTAVRGIVMEFLTGLNYYLTLRRLEGWKSEQKEIDQKRYEDWKLKNRIQEKRGRIKNVLLITITVAVIVALSIAARYYISGESQFFGHRTAIIPAVVTQTKFLPVPSGYKEVVNFTYYVGQHEYTGFERIGKSIGIKQVGDTIHLKVSLKKPRTFIIVPDKY